MNNFTNIRNKDLDIASEKRSLAVSVIEKQDNSVAQSTSKEMPSRRMVALIVVLVLVTLYHICSVALQNACFRIMEDYRWYSIPQQQKSCMKSREVEKMVELASRTSKALETLQIPSTVCYGTLWGVLRRKSVLKWDNNVDFCALNDYLKNVTFSDLQKAFAEEGVMIHDFSYWRGSYRLEREGATGFLNVFMDCTDLFYLSHSEYENKPPDYLPRPLPERPHWACAYSIATTVGRWMHDVNGPFPKWLLEPHFKKSSLDHVLVNVPHDGIEMQKYIYPDDWWLVKKPIECL